MNKYKKIKPWISTAIITSIKHREETTKIILLDKSINLMKKNYIIKRSHKLNKKFNENINVWLQW